MASVNQTRPHCVNQMGKTHSKQLAARHRRGTACYVCESAVRVQISTRIQIIAQETAIYRNRRIYNFTGDRAYLTDF